MGRGGRMTAPKEKVTGTRSLEMKRAPTEKPPFTLSQIKAAVPPHCFNRSLLRSFYYLIKDLLFTTLFFYIAIKFLPSLPLPLQLAAWPIYWFAQGCVMFAVWIVAHECGHQAFSNYATFNDVLGLILHCTLLVPYFSWKISHRRHHSNTASLENDENFVPTLKEGLPWYNTVTFLNWPVGRAFILLFMLTLGWPMYLIYNVAGREYPRFASHFDPYSPIFSDRERILIVISDVGLSIGLYTVYHVASIYGSMKVFMVYGAPLMIVNAWLVTTTYLHHTHRALPHYDSTEWNWLRGALATTDRDYGFLNRVFHRLTDTHVAHHLFSSIPHYHAMEVTKAIRPVLGDYYQYDPTPIWKAMWREVKECLYVEQDDTGNDKKKGIYWYGSELQ